jgi:hypothetical protein
VAIIVKTNLGLGAPGDSYASVADADDFHSDRGAADWLAASLVTREEKLRLATDWLDINYVWDTSQPRRHDTVDEYVGNIPAAVIQATIMLAREALTTTLANSQQERRVKHERVKVEGAVERETTYEEGIKARYVWLDALLAGYAVSGGIGSGMRMQRA